MPRSLVKDPEDEIRAIIFGVGCREINCAELARRTGRNGNTIRQWKSRPYQIPMRDMAHFVKELRLSVEERERLWALYAKL